ncbi:MAG: PCMD domain-containing protein [Bacteroidales bacterium]|nr:PCMD domain-containing protein [Bacteroidales bacterium]
MKRFAIILFAALLAAGCKTVEQEPGFLYVGVQFEGGSKAAMSDTELLSSALVRIYYADYSGLVKEYRYGAMPEKIFLPANSYRVDVLAGEAALDAPRRANFEQISYKGSQTFEISGGKDTHVVVEAGVNCAVTKVIFKNNVPANLKAGYSLSIGPDADHTLTYTAENEGTPGYFIVSDLDEPSFTWRFEGEKAKTGAPVVKEGVISGIEPGKAYELTIKYTVREGDVDFNIYVDTELKPIDDIIIFEPVSTGLVASADYEIWAAHATVHADVDEGEFNDPSTIFFEYSTDGTTWQSKAANRVSEGTYDAVLTGLAPSTHYSYRLVAGGEVQGDPMEFTTEDAPEVPNGSFEYTSTSASGKYSEFYNPNASDPLCHTPWWGSGNGATGVDGSADMGYVITAVDTSEKIDGNQSARLQSTWAVVKFAAGNLFTGSFGGLVGTKGGIVNFGRPFTARPTALRVWLKYSTGKINRIDTQPAGEHLTTNDYDRARVQIALGVWTPKNYGGTKDSPVQVNTTNTSTFVNYNTDPSTLAYGELVLTGNASNSHNSWKQYTIPIDWKDVITKPQFIIISCASSMYGDYFTGCDSAKLWIDKMEFVYE